MHAWYSVVKLNNGSMSRVRLCVTVAPFCRNPRVRDSILRAAADPGTGAEPRTGGGEVPRHLHRHQSVRRHKISTWNRQVSEYSCAGTVGLLKPPAQLNRLSDTRFQVITWICRVSVIPVTLELKCTWQTKTVVRACEPLWCFKSEVRRWPEMSLGPVRSVYKLLFRARANSAVRDWV
jgi:hypothetical protein